MNILIVSAECAPFAKTGGLGDVVGALPSYLENSGNNVVIVIPLYLSINTKKYKIEPEISNLEVTLGNETFSCGVMKSYTKGRVPVYFIDYPGFFHRKGLYHDSFYNDYTDNPFRFAFLSKAALQLCRHINYKPDIIHANDWHTAVIPAFVKRLYRNDPFFENSASILTIHNVAYQGQYNRDWYSKTGLGWEDFTQDKFEHHGDVNFLKGGIHFADIVNTVSEGYAAETRIAPGGYGLEYFLNQKGNDYVGILNGVDYTEWNPETDKLIPSVYSINDLSGKAECKKFLQKQLGLQVDSDVALIGIVSRLVEQKGFHIIAECMSSLISSSNIQFAILGTGDNKLERFFSGLPQRFPGKAGVYIGYDNELAHVIEAGSDFFLMPSIYEPCGLNQIYSLKYGTLPIVRATGGLNDTIVNYDQKTGEGTGFKFNEPSCKAAYNTILWVLDTFYYRKLHINKLIQNAMSQHFSWDDSATKYLRMYGRALQKITTH
ncbi:MAG TPA: glycogen synthase GlgA [Bacteroidales bacterium]|nr:glycogen synthase GlgA [Bacteroidales bacterium]